MCAQTCLVSNLKRQASGLKLTISYIKGLELNVKVFREFKIFYQFHKWILFKRLFQDEKHKHTMFSLKYIRS